MERIEIGQLIDALCQRLDCSQRVISNLLGIDPHTLSRIRDKLLEEGANTKAIRRLAVLYYIVARTLVLVDSETAVQILQKHIFPDLQDRLDSVISALQQDKYPPEVLVQIAELSLKQHKEQALEHTFELSHVAASLSA